MVGRGAQTRRHHCQDPEMQRNRGFIDSQLMVVDLGTSKERKDDRDAHARTSRHCSPACPVREQPDYVNIPLCFQQASHQLWRGTWARGERSKLIVHHHHPADRLHQATSSASRINVFSQPQLCDTLPSLTRRFFLIAKHPNTTYAHHVLASLVGTGHIDKAAIISAAGDSTWAATPGFSLKPEETQALVAILNGNGSGPAVDKAFSDGVYVQGERYVAFNVEDRHVYGRHGRTGIIVVKTKQAILVAHYGESQIAGNSTQTVEALADYLIKAGY
ncbi:profilin [Cercophora scortea]|uniref:Profilin n=1 Tax=Cercophora scortea TaxID=314031 RepID=A0AAE0M911_9PEZI|nr:profilin [Cercophora scortea]